MIFHSLSIQQKSPAHPKQSVLCSLNLCQKSPFTSSVPGQLTRQRHHPEGPFPLTSIISMLFLDLSCHSSDRDPLPLHQCTSLLARISSPFPLPHFASPSAHLFAKSPLPPSGGSHPRPELRSGSRQELNLLMLPAVYLQSWQRIQHRAPSARAATSIAGLLD